MIDNTVYSDYKKSACDIFSKEVVALPLWQLYFVFGVLDDTTIPTLNLFDATLSKSS